jgi:hypothetical protein
MLSQPGAPFALNWLKIDDRINVTNKVYAVAAALQGSGMPANTLD